MKHARSCTPNLGCVLGSLVCAALLALAFLVLKPHDLPSGLSPIHEDALNRTMGFQHVYVTHDGDLASMQSFKAMAALLDIDYQVVTHTSAAGALVLQQESRYLAEAREIAELDTHARVYADMVENNVQSAIVLKSTIDVELDIKQRLGTILSNSSIQGYDMLFIGRTHTEPHEPHMAELEFYQQQARRTGDSSMQMQWQLARREFAHGAPTVFRSSLPRGICAYAIGGRMARRLHRRLRSRMPRDSHDLDFILADIAMVGLSLTYSVSPPPITYYNGSRPHDGQFLARSALHSMAFRQDDPAVYAPFTNLREMWQK
ncbi:hypothetical protein GGF46_002268 [Coemansia sp. RSA 552]|nr:hypothetical protein GGF46_002268 [Coemansia sp. RSA 552]